MREKNKSYIRNERKKSCDAVPRKIQKNSVKQKSKAWQQKHIFLRIVQTRKQGAKTNSFGNIFIFIFENLATKTKWRSTISENLKTTNYFFSNIF